MGVNTYSKFKGTVGNGTTKYVGLIINPNGSINAQLAWLDTTTAGAVTVELTNYDSDDAPEGVADASGYKWKPSGVALTGPAGGSIGSLLINIENVRQRRARLVFVASAASKIEVTQ